MITIIVQVRSRRSIKNMVSRYEGGFLRLSGAAARTGNFNENVRI